MTSTTTAVRRSLTAAGCLALTVTFAACGNDDTVDVTSNASAAPSTNTQQQGGPGAGGRSGFPGASGEVVALSGTTAQVRNDRTGQVAVTWNDSTTFTATKTGTLADLKAGNCVVVVGASDGKAASRVTVSEAVDGECRTPGAGRPAGGDFQPPEGMELPEGMTPPEGGERPEGMPNRGAITSGKLTAISGTTLTIGDKKVEVASDASVTLPATATEADVKTGVCVTAQGEADSTGAVTAKTISVSEKVDGECGFGGGFPGSGFPGAAAGSGSGEQS